MHRIFFYFWASTCIESTNLRNLPNPSSRLNKFCETYNQNIIYPNAKPIKSWDRVQRRPWTAVFLLVFIIVPIFQYLFLAWLRWLFKNRMFIACSLNSSDVAWKKFQLFIYRHTLPPSMIKRKKKEISRGTEIKNQFWNQKQEKKKNDRNTMSDTWLITGLVGCSMDKKQWRAFFFFICIYRNSSSFDVWMETNLMVW